MRCNTYMNKIHSKSSAQLNMLYSRLSRMPHSRTNSYLTLHLHSIRKLVMLKCIAFRILFRGFKVNSLLRRSNPRGSRYDCPVAENEFTINCLPSSDPPLFFHLNVPALGNDENSGQSASVGVPNSLNIFCICWGMEIGWVRSMGKNAKDNIISSVLEVAITHIKFTITLENCILY